MGWKKTSERKDKQGGTWSNYEDSETGERIQVRENPNGSTSIFKNGKKVNKKGK